MRFLHIATYTTLAQVFGNIRRLITRGNKWHAISPGKAVRVSQSGMGRLSNYFPCYLKITSAFFFVRLSIRIQYHAPYTRRLLVMVFQDVTSLDESFGWSLILLFRVRFLMNRELDLLSTCGRIVRTYFPYVLLCDSVTYTKLLRHQSLDICVIL